MNLVDRFAEKYGRLPTERDPDYLEMLRMSKYRILPIPDVGASLKCANCGAGKADGRKYIDFGLQVDWYGVVYLCTECLRDIAEKAGLFRTFELTILHLEEKIQGQKEAKLALDDFRTTVLKTFEEVNERFVSIHSSGDALSPDSNTSVDSVKDKSGKPGINSPESGTPETESRVTKSSSVSGRKNLPQLADLLKLED